MSTYERGKLIRFIPNRDNKTVAIFNYHDRNAIKPSFDIVCYFDLGKTIEQVKQQAPHVIHYDD